MVEHKYHWDKGPFIRNLQTTWWNDDPTPITEKYWRYVDDKGRPLFGIWHKQIKGQRKCYMIIHVPTGAGTSGYIHLDFAKAVCEELAKDNFWRRLNKVAVSSAASRRRQELFQKAQADAWERRPAGKKWKIA